MNATTVTTNPRRAARRNAAHSRKWPVAALSRGAFHTPQAGADKKYGKTNVPVSVL